MYSDQGARSLGGATFVNTTGMTVESCVAFCSAQDFNFAGLEFAQECCTRASSEIGDKMECADASRHDLRVRQRDRQRRHQCDTLRLQPRVHRRREGDLWRWK